MADDEKTKFFDFESGFNENDRARPYDDDRKTEFFSNRSPMDDDKTTIIKKPKRAEQLAWLVVFKGKRNLGKFDLSQDDYLIGRGNYCDIQLDDEDNEISKLHGRIRYDELEKKFYYYDCGSANGSKINGAEVMKKDLEDNDRIAMGPFEAIFKKI